MLDLHHEENSKREIVTQPPVSRPYVDKVVKRYNEANVSILAPKTTPGPRKIDTAASEFIEVERLMKPSIDGKEIQQRLLLDGVLQQNDIPPISQINKVFRAE
ncbi:paired box protein Pax-8-like [Nematostella vectensis]|uniref:paired box protein Pax-8-like n=1 Tax=Nematostella vectensis TaxID=45351 RepID=UPI002077176B|nr:paired box protein Pax-8-like [Nematostella vectensis]